MQLDRLKAGPVEPHAMIGVSMLLSVINKMGRNVASVFCHEIINTFPEEPLTATCGTRLKNTDVRSTLIICTRD